MKQRNLAVIAATTALVGSFHAMALEVTSSFGALPEATFGGSGIPNDAVAITRIVDAGDPQNPNDGYTVTLGLAAHGRYGNPPVSNNGAGVFYALPGLNEPPGAGPGALWNFDFYAAITGSGAGSVSFADEGDYSLHLLYDSNPAVNTPETEMGVWDVSKSIVFGFPLGSTFQLTQSSQNLAFGFLASDYLVGSDPVIDAPLASFNPYVGGEYSFALVLKDSSGKEYRSSMTVVVQTPDASGAFGLLGFGVMALLGLRRQWVD